MTIVGAVEKALLNGGTTAEDVSGWDGLADEVDAAPESVEDGETEFEGPALSPFPGLVEAGDEPGEGGEEEEEDEEEGELEEGAAPAWILSELAGGGHSGILFGPGER